MYDPTRDEMKEVLTRQMPGQDEWVTEPAMYWFASDFHGGQGSNLYIALCKSPYKPGILERECPEDAQDCYDELVHHFTE